MCERREDLDQPYNQDCSEANNNPLLSLPIKEIFECEIIKWEVWYGNMKIFYPLARIMMRLIFITN